MTTAELQELLPLHALELLVGDEAAAVERAVAADPALAGELAALRDAAHVIAAPIEPPPDLERRLAASVGAGRFERFAKRIGALMDLAIDPVRELLGRLERPWPAPRPDEVVPGLSLIHFEGGPACAAADCGFVRVEPGHMFPWHTHRGTEHSLVLAGRMRTSDGNELTPGDEYVALAGSSHDLATVGDEPVIFVACAFSGIAVGPRPKA